MKKSFRQIFCVIFMFFAFVSMAQKQTEIIGKIVDSDGIETPGATVLVKGTTIGTMTDYKGNYKINVSDPQKTILVYSFIGDTRVFFYWYDNQRN